MERERDELLSGQAWRDFCDRLKAAGDGLRGPGRPDAPRDRAEGYRWLTRLAVHALRSEVEAGDPLHPVFVRYETPDNQWGGPNPDNLYLRAAVDPRESYRVWGNVRGVRNALFSLHEGDMQLGQYGVYGETSLDALAVDGEGRLEIQLSAAQPPGGRGNWIALDPKARLFGIRVYSSDWERDASPRFFIERVGAEGVPRPPLEPDALARSLGRAAAWVEASARYWPEYTRAGEARATVNVAGSPAPAKGGADHILYGSCIWDLAADEALLLECDEPDADYWGFTIHTLGWLESGDFAERQTSLNHEQVHRDTDGRIRLVLAQRDPGAPNWIDTEERPRGMLLYRFVGARGRPQPEARVVPLAALGDALPPDHPRVDAAERRRRLARRREAAWSRFL